MTIKIQPAPAKTAPEGYLEDAKGRLVPQDQISPLEIEEDALVRHVYEMFKAQHELLTVLKLKTFSGVQALVDLADEQYGAKIGGKKGNLTLYSFDGRIKLTRKNADDIAFGIELQAAKALIDECLHEWTEGGPEEIKALITDAFRVDKEGKISTGKVLGLRRHKFKHPKWRRAMEAISDAVKVVAQKSYVQVFVRASSNPDAAWVNLSLDFARV